MAKVYLGVGHGGTDPGAVGNGLKEKDLTLSISKACATALKRCGIDYKISRTTDKDYPVEKRIEDCNKYNPDLALDIHINAGGGNGAEVFYSIVGGTGKTLAEKILQRIKNLGQESRGAKVKATNGVDYFGFIRQTVCPAVIVECAFIDNKSDIAIVKTAAQQKTMGEAIAKGICDCLGVKYVAEPVKKQTTVTKPTSLKKGDRVRVVKAVQYDNGKPFKAWFPIYTVISVKGNRVVIGVNQVVTAAVHVKNLTKV